MTPNKDLLEKYARVLIDFALNDGEGIKKGDVVYLVTQSPGIPLAQEVYRSIIRSGGFPLIQIQDDSFSLISLLEGSDEQLTF
ncbi:MAG: aminopeptidase, partial [Fibrobacter sp.]|nr:aminopeptidase [Fibrobacter sp.]